MGRGGCSKPPYSTINPLSTPRDADDLLTEMLGFGKEGAPPPAVEPAATGDTTRRRSKNLNDVLRESEGVSKIEPRHLYPMFADSASSCDGKSQASDGDATLAYGDGTFIMIHIFMYILVFLILKFNFFFFVA